MTLDNKYRKFLPRTTGETRRIMEFERGLGHDLVDIVHMLAESKSVCGSEEEGESARVSA